MPRKILRDDQYARIEGMLPGKATDVGVTAKDNRLFVEAVWAAAGSVDTDLSFSSLLELYRTDVAERRVPARRVVEALDVVEHV